MFVVVGCPISFSCHSAKKESRMTFIRFNVLNLMCLKKELKLQ